MRKVSILESKARYILRNRGYMTFYPFMEEEEEWEEYIDNLYDGHDEPATGCDCFLHPQ